MAVGAFAAYNFNLRVPGLPLGQLVLAGRAAAAIGLVFGLPSLRLRGFYLAVSTLAAQFFVQWALTNFRWFSNDNPSGVIERRPSRFRLRDRHAARPIFSRPLTSSRLDLSRRAAARTQAGHEFHCGARSRGRRESHRRAGIEDQAARLRRQLLHHRHRRRLWAFAYLRTVEPDGFNLDRSFQILFIIIIGGLATIRGAFLGAAFIVVLPLLLSRAGARCSADLSIPALLDMIQRIIIGALIIVFLIAEPDGLAAL